MFLYNAVALYPRPGSVMRGDREGLDERELRLLSRIRGYDPVRLARLVEEHVTRGDERKYFRFRWSRFYGGSAVGDVVGCNLRCVFCWTGRARDDLRLGFFVSSREAARRLISLSRGRGRVVRLSAGEPTIGWHHLLGLLERLRGSGRLFVLETNGVLIGHEASRAAELAEYGDLVHVRLSLKACSPRWFKLLTGASERGFELQLAAAEALAKSGVSFHVSVFAAFGTRECWSRLLSELSARVGPGIVENIEVEPLVLYPPARRRLRILGLRPTNPSLVYEPGR